MNKSAFVFIEEFLKEVRKSSLRSAPRNSNFIHIFFRLKSDNQMKTMNNKPNYQNSISFKMHWILSEKNDLKIKRIGVINRLFSPSGKMDPLQAAKMGRNTLKGRINEMKSVNTICFEKQRI